MVEACIKFIKCTIKKCIHTKSNKHIAVLQIRSTQLQPALPSHATLLFNIPARGIMPILSRLLISSKNDDDHYKALVKRQTEKEGTMILPEITILFQ